MGASIAPTQLAGVLALPRQRSGLASACIATTRQGGTAHGVAVLGLIIASAAASPDGPAPERAADVASPDGSASRTGG